MNWSTALLLTLLIAVASVRAETTAVKPEEQVEFRQKTVEAQMQELQERMYRLGEMTREAEPDDSARLLMAVRKAREGLIIEQMKEVLDVLDRNDLGRASDDQTQVIAKLEELKKLLTTTDLDLELQLQKLRDLNKAIAQLDAAIKDEKRQRDHTGEIAKAPATQPLGPGPLAGAKTEQQQTRHTTETVAQAVKDIGPGPAKAGDVLSSAVQSMSMAEGNLGGGKPGDASSQQSQAVDQMQKARDQLEAERQKIIQELERQVRKQVVLNLMEMLDRQKAVREATEGMVGTMGGEPSGSTVGRAKQLATSETSIITIGDQTLALIEETKFSIALPPALRAVDAECATIVGSLQDNQIGEPLVVREKQVEQDLSDLIDTFKQLASAKMGNGQCNCKGDKNKLLAELRVIRMMQVRVNAQTTEADADRGGQVGGQADLSPDLQAKIAAARDGQGQVRDATEAIHKELAGQ
jgi:cytochrome c556